MTIRHLFDKTPSMLDRVKRDRAIATRTLELARERGMDLAPRPSSGTCSTHFHHLEGMLDTLKAGGMDDGKRGRFIGWMQCAVVVAGFATMEEFKEINRAILSPDWDGTIPA